MLKQAALSIVQDLGSDELQPVAPDKRSYLQPLTI